MSRPTKRHQVVKAPGASPLSEPMQQPGKGPFINDVTKVGRITLTLCMMVWENTQFCVTKGEGVNFGSKLCDVIVR